MKASSLVRFLVPALALLVAMTLGGIVQAQPIFPTASGCKESAILTTEQFFNPGTGGFTIDRTIIPGEDTRVVLGSWVIVDGFVGDPTAGAPATPNCAASPGDLNPTYVIKMVAKPISGDPVAVGVKTVTFWLDNDVDGHITEGKDTQFSAPLPGTCLTSAAGCELSFGNRPLFTGAGVGGGLADSAGFPIPGVPCTAPGGGPSCGALVLVADLENSKAGATLQVRLEGFTADLVNLGPPFGPGAFSSDFAPQYKKQASNSRVIVQGSSAGPGILSPAVNNASGNPETGALGIGVTGIRTRDDRGGLAGTQERDARPGDREYFVGLVGVCDGGELVTNQIAILPPIAGATPTIAGGLGAIPCIATTVGATDLLPTNIVRIRVGVSGPGAQWVQAVHIYADDCLAPDPATLTPCGWALPLGGTASVLFEAGELIYSAIPVNGVVAVGSLEQTLLTSGGTPLVLVPGVVGGPNFPSLLYFTMDIDDRANASQVLVQVAIDVADVPGGPPGFPGVGTSRLLRTKPQEFTVQISGSAAPPPLGGVEQFDTNKNGVIDDAEFFNAIDQWVDGGITDDLFFRVLDAWVAQTPVAGTSLEGLSLKAVKLSTSNRATTFVASGQGITSMGVEIFDLAGRQVFAQQTTGTRLTWNLSAQGGETVANGVYFYMVTVRGADGQTLRSEVKKLVVLR